MQSSLFRYIWQHTRREQIWIISIILISLPFLFLSLDLPKLIVNGPIQGKGFTKPDATVRVLEIKPALPDWLGGFQFNIFNGFELDRMGALLALSFVFLALVCINGLFKYYINTFKGRLGERMLRRLRYELVDRVLRFPMGHFRKVKSAEIATMVKDEVEPLGGFIGDAFVQPVFLLGQALTAMVFILVQSFWLGLIAASIVLVQAFLIPRLRRRLLVLGKQQQLTARDLAGRVSEVVDGITEVRTNDATNYERADIASRLARIFFIRYELYQRKFFVKFLNNFLAQLTPFLFFLIGGYFAIHGTLDIGQLVAVIAAYKDLPGPIKELIDWDQQRQDVQIKYTQVSDQFSPGTLINAVLQEPNPGPVPRIDRAVEIRALSIVDDTGARVLEPVDLAIAPQEWVAAVGEINAGAEAVADAIARLANPTSGRIRIGDVHIDAAADSYIGRRIAYVGPDTYLRNTTIRDALLHGLRNYPLRPASNADRHHRYLIEARASGNTELDIAADWLDYDRLAVADDTGVNREIVEVLAMTQIEDDIFEFGLRSRPQAIDGGIFEAKILEARSALADKLASGALGHLVEPFDPTKYQEQATIAENLIFGEALKPAFQADELSDNELVLGVLRESGLNRDLFEVGRKIAATVVELFADLPPDHPFFARLSFATPEELPAYTALLARIGDRAYDSVQQADRHMILGLAFGYIEPQHRLSLLDDRLRAQIVAVRQQLTGRIVAEAPGALAPYETGRYNVGSTLEANILFGRISHGVADAAPRVRQAVRQTLADLGLREIVLEAGLQFNCGPGGKRLTSAQRQKIALARALLKRPDLLVVNRGLGSLSPRVQRSIIEVVSERCRGRNGAHQFATFWVLATPSLIDIFDRVVVFHDGRITADGSAASLLESNDHLQRLVA